MQEETKEFYVAQTVVVYYVGYSFFVGKEIMSRSSNGLDGFSRCHLCIAFVFFIIEN